MISEIAVATVAVSDLARSLAFYERTFGYVRLGTGPVDSPGHRALWNMPEGLTGNSVVLAPEGATTGMLRLVQFDQPGQRIWGNYHRPQDYGHYALNIRVPELRQTISRVHEHGGTARSTPTHWKVTPELSAWDSLSHDPDGVVLDVFQLEATAGSLMADYDGRCTELQTVAVHTSNARNSARFYAALGFRPWYDKLLTGMEEFFQLPPGTDLHNINLIMPEGSSAGRVELAQYVGFPGRSQRASAVPPNLGILSVSLETDDLDQTAALLHSIGTEPLSDLVSLELAPFGPVRARTYYGPDDEVLEFFQRV